MNMYPEKDFYSDANFNENAYGSVKGYTMDDGKYLNLKLILMGLLKDEQRRP